MSEIDRIAETLRIEISSMPYLKNQHLSAIRAALLEYGQIVREEKIPREPTDEMVAIGMSAAQTLAHDWENHPDTVAALMWKAMYDAAIKEKS